MDILCYCFLLIYSVLDKFLDGTSVSPTRRFRRSCNVVMAFWTSELSSWNCKARLDLNVSQCMILTMHLTAAPLVAVLGLWRCLVRFHEDRTFLTTSGPLILLLPELDEHPTVLQLRDVKVSVYLLIVTVYCLPYSVSLYGSGLWWSSSHSQIARSHPSIFFDPDSEHASSSSANCACCRVWLARASLIFGVGKHLLLCWHGESNRWCL